MWSQKQVLPNPFGVLTYKTNALVVFLWGILMLAIIAKMGSKLCKVLCQPDSHKVLLAR